MGETTEGEVGDNGPDRDGELNKGEFDPKVGDEGPTAEGDEGPTAEGDEGLGTVGDVGELDLP